MNIPDSPAKAPGRNRPDGAAIHWYVWMAQRLKFALLTNDPRQQLRLAQSGLANLLMLGCVVMANMLSASGRADGRWIPTWTIASIGGMLAIFALIRSGRVLAWRDPSLTLLQMFYAVTCAAVAYCITGSDRGVVIPILAVVLMFGMFGMTQRQVAVVGIYALLVFGGAGFYWLEFSGQQQSRDSEFARLSMVVIVIAGVIVLTGRLQKMRSRLRAQREALAAALLRIGELATRDELTGCLNRRAILERMPEELARCARSGNPVSIVLLDLDHFKQINDAFGHAAGDSVLRGFAQLARSGLRTDDALARWGGEEFLLLLGNTDTHQAEPCVRRLLVSIAQARFSCLGSDTVVTCSAGIAQYKSGETIEEVVERSDQALYRAKHDGRNRLMTSE